MIVTESNITFDFTKAPDFITAFKFDCPSVHGFTALKAVDIIAEFAKYYVFIEVKNFCNPQTSQATSPKKELLDDLRNKYIDTWVYRTLSEKIEKAIHYVCVLENLSPQELLKLDENLQRRLPKEAPKHEEAWGDNRLIASTAVVDKDIWNRQFAHWATLT